ncbi:glycine receptor subunit alpha-2-like isoform X2 [Tachypleus tridentatus]|uniref:glycine receptor subunit alpha-2-like isoform X2 n=1 Tax=Tachypleus tridentatus TaxID=6853 RepID=UPI003FD217A9
MIRGRVRPMVKEYVVDVYLRQSWFDSRLDIRPLGLNSTVTLNGEDIINRIWKPDLFFRNVKEANFHMVTVPNILIKLSPDGHILYSMRLTLRLSCHMSFRHYPLDTQRCHVIFGSYSQSVESMTLTWMDNAVLLDPNLEISEFEVVSVDPEGPVFENYNDVGVFSYLNVTFVLKRQNGYHMVQTYLPTFLIVTISWVSFWLNVDAVPARVTLGVTTLLTLTTVASGVRTQLPPVSYVKAIDVWIGACSVMVFGALLEFTLVNYLSRSKMKAEHLKSFRFFSRNKQVTSKEEEKIEDVGDTSIKRVSSAGVRNLQYAKRVDKVCRISFPLSFFVFNLVYWISYVYILEN